MTEEDLRATESRTLQLPESVFYALQQIGRRLTCIERGERTIDTRRALELCMVLADQDADRAAKLCQNLADAVGDWNALEQLSSERVFAGQPIP